MKILYFRCSIQKILMRLSLRYQYYDYHHPHILFNFLVAANCIRRKEKNNSITLKVVS